MLSPTTVNALRVSYSRVTQNQYTPNYGFTASSLGSKVYDYLPNVMGLNITSGFTLTGKPRRIAANLYQLADDVSLTRGAHQFGFGGRIAQSRTIGETGDTILPNFTVSGEVTGLGLSDFLLGRVSGFLQGIGSGNYLRMKYVNLYSQDTWQMRPRLSVSYGLRWSPVLPLVDYRRPIPNVSNFDENRFLQGIRSQVFVNAPPGLIYAGDTGLVQNNNGANAAKPQADLWKPYWKEFAPRLGLAWDVRGDGRQKLSASWGIFYDVMKYELPRGSFGGDVWKEFYYALDDPSMVNTLGAKGFVNMSPMVFTNRVIPI